MLPLWFLCAGGPFRAFRNLSNPETATASPTRSSQSTAPLPSAAPRWLQKLQQPPRRRLAPAIQLVDQFRDPSFVSFARQSGRGKVDQRTEVGGGHYGGSGRSRDETREVPLGRVAKAWLGPWSTDQALSGQHLNRVSTG